MGSLGTRLKQALHDQKVTQRILAERVGLAQASVSQFCNDVASPGPRTVKAICDALSINELWLRTGEGPMERETPKTIIDELARTYSLSPDAVRILQIIAQAFQRLTPEQAHEMVEIARRNLLDMGEAARDSAAVRDAIEKSPDASGPESMDQNRA